MIIYFFIIIKIFSSGYPIELILNAVKKVGIMKFILLKLVLSANNNANSYAIDIF